MKTFVWANTWVDSFEYEFVIAMADTVEEARQVVKNQIQADIANEISIALLEVEKGITPLEGIMGIKERIKQIETEWLQIIEDVIKHEPSHIISNRMAMVIPHGNE
jgi:hypothetical protein